MNKFENLPIYGNLIMLNVFQNVARIVVQSLKIAHAAKMQMLAALHKGVSRNKTIHL